MRHNGFTIFLWFMSEKTKEGVAPPRQIVSLMIFFGLFCWNQHLWQQAALRRNNKKCPCQPGQPYIHTLLDKSVKNVIWCDVLLKHTSVVWSKMDGFKKCLCSLLTLAQCTPCIVQILIGQDSPPFYEFRRSNEKSEKRKNIKVCTLDIAKLFTSIESKSP